MTNLKRKILTDEKFLTSPLAIFLKKFNVTLVTDKNAWQECDAILEDSFEELRKKRIVTSEEAKNKFSDSSVVFVKNEFAALEASAEDAEKMFLALISSSGFGFSDINVTDLPLMNLKVQDQLSFGYIQDRIIIEAHKNKHDILPLRKDISELLCFLFQSPLVEKEEHPVELNFLINDQYVGVDFSFFTNDFQSLNQSLSEEIKTNSFLKFMTLEGKRQRVSLSLFYSSLFKNIEIEFFMKPEEKMDIHLDKESGLEILERSEIEINNRVVVKAESETEEVESLSFTSFDEDEVVTKVSGLNFEELKSVAHLEGITEHILTNEVWEVKRLEIGKAVAEELRRKETTDKVIDSNEIAKIVSQKSSLPLELSKELSKGISQWLFNNGSIKKEAPEEVSARHVDGANKEEIIKLKGELLSLKNYSKKVLNMAKVKEAHNKKLKKDLEQLNKNLQQEKKSQAAVESRTENASYGYELETLRISLGQAQEVVEELKRENERLQRILAPEKLALETLNQEYKKSAEISFLKGQNEENKEALESVKGEIQALEAKLKEESLEHKKTQQHLKYANTQYESLLKKYNHSQGNGGKGAGHFNQQIERLKANQRKSQEELTEKKREILKLKQENQSFSTKLAELERKLAGAEKKAA